VGVESTLPEDDVLYDGLLGDESSSSEEDELSYFFLATADTITGWTTTFDPTVDARPAVIRDKLERAEIIGCA
jgi:hypothetical protein